MDCWSDCNHKFCAECLQRYCQYKISVMEEIVCPEVTCDVSLSLYGSVYHRLSQ
jgi:hypothetical protein